jgi:hypothetical protein
MFVVEGLIPTFCGILALVFNKPFAEYHVTFLRRVGLRRRPYNEVMVARVMYIALGCIAIAFGMFHSVAYLSGQ